MPKLDKRRANPSPANWIGARVKEARLMKGFSQALCAEMLQAELTRLYPGLHLVIDQSDLSRLENGRRPVWDYEVRSLAVILETSADWLLGLKGEA